MCCSLLTTFSGKSRAISHCFVSMVFLTLVYVALSRFTQAGSEVSALLGRIPSAVGYQPTLATDMVCWVMQGHLHREKWF
jgi:hypothetical protein